MQENINLFNKWTITRKQLLIYILAGLGLVFVSLFLFVGGMQSLSRYGNNSIVSKNYGVDDGYYESADIDEAAGYPAEAPASIEADFLGEAEEELYRAEQSVSSTTASIPQDRLIIKDGFITMQMEDTRDSRSRIHMMVDSMADKGAFIVSSYEYVSNQAGNPYINMVIRIPSEQFSLVMDQLADMAVEVDERNESAKDVTEEYVDLENRIGAMEAARDRLLEIMKGAETTEDLLQIEWQLTQRDAELEALKGRLSYLTGASKLSRISINLYPHLLSEPIDTSWRPAETIRRAVDRLIYRTQNFADGLINFMIVALPGILVYGVIIYLGYRVVKRIFRKKPSTEK